MMRPFRAVPNGTTRQQAATVLGAAPLLPGFPAGGGCQVRIWNRGTVPVMVEFGANAAMPLPVAPGANAGGAQSIPPGVVEIQTLQSNQRHVAVAVLTGTPDVDFTVGDGG